MKKTIKRIITGILAVSTIASSAFLLAGCGEKSEEEKMKDAVNDAYNSYKISSKLSSMEEETVEKEKVELDLIEKIVSDKLYTVKFIPNSNGGNFYIHINDTIDIDGYTVELQDKTDEYNYGYSQDWDIKKDGETLASFEMDRDTQATKEINDNNKIVGNIWIESSPTSEENSAVDFEFTETSRDGIEADVPAALTEAECKQHMDELKAAAWDKFKDGFSVTNEDGKELSHPNLDGVYYFYGDYDFLGGVNNPEKTYLVFDYSLNIDQEEHAIYLGPNRIYGVIERPFILDGELNFCSSYTESWSFDDEEMAQGKKIG